METRVGATGVPALGHALHDNDDGAGFSFDNRRWPRGRTGSATTHAVVFSR
jgi:hypothetical protein